MQKLPSGRGRLVGSKSTTTRNVHQKSATRSLTWVQRNKINCLIRGTWMSSAPAPRVNDSVAENQSGPSAATHVHRHKRMQTHIITHLCEQPRHQNYTTTWRWAQQTAAKWTFVCSRNVHGYLEARSLSVLWSRCTHSWVFNSYKQAHRHRKENAVAHGHISV